jgi:2-amino-4-hydroxy-6-hydroxymethyldihydropteridine diphosphokinase
VTIAYLALGANVGDRERNLAEARRLLSERGVRVLRASAVRETEPYGVTDQPRFLNQVVEVEWAEGPRQLLAATRSVEASLGRTPTRRWGPREIDVDILLFGDESVSEPDLVIPHPGLAEREFVRGPLAELRPDLVPAGAARQTTEDTADAAPGDPLRIAWLGHTSTALGGGMATYSREVVARLRRRGHRVTFFQHDLPASGKEGGAQAAGEADEAVFLESVPLAGRLVLSSPRARRRLKERLERRDFDVVHASFWFSSLDFDLPRTCRRVGVPLVATFHVAFDHRLSVWGGITSATYRLYAPTLAACDRVIVFGASQRDVLIDLGVPPEGLRILPNGVDVDVYRPGPSDWKARLEASLLLVYMGRVDSEKNVDILLRAFLDCAPPADVKLVVMGGGGERRRLQRQFRDPRVVFTGHVADARTRIDVLRAADAFFLPSSVEGLSLSMLEAMACGAATVATDVGVDGDALRGAGVVLDPHGLEEQLRLAIRQLMETPWLAPPLGEAARRRVEERYSLDRNVDALVGVYRELLP